MVVDYDEQSSLSYCGEEFSFDPIVAEFQLRLRLPGLEQQLIDLEECQKIGRETLDLEITI